MHLRRIGRQVRKVPRIGSKIEAHRRLETRYASEVRALGVASALLIDGSHVTIKSRPNDIDLILILREDLDLKPESTPAEYNVRSIVRRT